MAHPDTDTESTALAAAVIRHHGARIHLDNLGTALDEWRSAGIFRECAEKSACDRLEAADDRRRRRTAVAVHLHRQAMKEIAMRFLQFMRSTPGRIVRVAFGTTLFWIGAALGTLAGLMMMVVGLIPVVTGVANVCLLEDVVREFIRFRCMYSDAGRRHRHI